MELTMPPMIYCVECACRCQHRCLTLQGPLSVAPEVRQYIGILNNNLVCLRRFRNEVLEQC